MVKFLMEKIIVSALKVLTGMASGVLPTTVKEDKFGMVKNVHVSQVTITMALYACSVLTGRSGTKERKHVIVLQDIFGTVTYARNK